MALSRRKAAIASDPDNCKLRKEKWMKKLFLTAAVLASISTSARAATYNLGSLVSGNGSFTYDGLTFSNFSADSTGPNAVNLNYIDLVTVSKGGGAGFTLTGSLEASASGNGDLALSYDVSAAPGTLITDAYLHGNGVAVNGAEWNVGENYTNPANNAQVGKGLAIYNGSFGVSTADSETFAGVTTLEVSKDIGWSGGGASNGFVDLSQVDQTFSVAKGGGPPPEAPGPVPGAGYWGLFGLALGAAALKLRQRFAS
jgi:hypothetical protein